MPALVNNPRIANAFDKARADALPVQSKNPNHIGKNSAAEYTENGNQTNQSSSWNLTDLVKGMFSSAPVHLLHVPLLKHYVLKNYIMPWVFRDPNVEKFDPMIFKNRGFRVLKIPNNDLIQGDKFLILPKHNQEYQEPKIIIHGARTSARSLGGAAQAALDAGNPVIIGDISGFGSDQGGFNTETIQNDIEGLIDFAHARFKKPFSIIAHSFGTHNAVAALTKAMKRNPDIRTKELILISPWDSFHKVVQGLWEIDHKNKTGRPRIETLLHEANEPHAKNAIASLSESHLDLIKDLAETSKVFEETKDLKERMGNISIFWGSEDKHIAPKHSQDLVKELRKLGYQAKEVKMQGIGHSDATSRNTTNIAKNILKTASLPYRNELFTISP